jgi:hypothetical protein
LEESADRAAAARSGRDEAVADALVLGDDDALDESREELHELLFAGDGTGSAPVTIPYLVELVFCARSPGARLRMLSELTFNVFAMITDQVDCAHRARFFNAPRPHDPQAVATFEALRPYVPSLLATWPAQPPVVRRGLIGLAVEFPQAGMALYAE